MVFEAANISPVPLPLSDVLTGLQTGLIDTVGASPIGAIALQWHTRVKYVTDTPLMYLYGTLIVDKKSFEQISAADQAVVKEVMNGVFHRLDRINREENRQARRALQEQGLVFVEPAHDSEKRWGEIVVAALDHGSSGLFSSQIIATLQHHLDEYRARH
jgi:TRAP-type C4-dicarboxylate transport system substrate-binding protein